MLYQLSYVRNLWCPPPDSNRHSLRNHPLKMARLPFRQVGMKDILGHYVRSGNAMRKIIEISDEIEVYAIATARLRRGPRVWQNKIQIRSVRRSPLRLRKPVGETPDFIVVSAGLLIDHFSEWRSGCWFKGLASLHLICGGEVIAPNGVRKSCGKQADIGVRVA